jgi:hypothetical protein
MNSNGLPAFFQEFNIDPDKEASTNKDYSTLVMNQYFDEWKYTFPFVVARLLDTPRGPTQYQDALRQTIHPLISAREYSAYGWSRDLQTWQDVPETNETLLVSVEGFINSVLLGCLYYFKIWDTEKATEMAQYIKQIFSLTKQGDSIWSLIPKNLQTDRYYEVGEITTLEQLKDPYGYQAEIFRGGS